MRPSSSHSDLFGAVLARGEVHRLVDDGAWLAAMLAVEAALARVAADLGVIPHDAAQAIAAACEPSRLDVGALGAAAAADGNPVIPLVAALREAVGRV